MCWTPHKQLLQQTGKQCKLSDNCGCSSAVEHLLAKEVGGSNPLTRACRRSSVARAPTPDPRQGGRRSRFESGRRHLPMRADMPKAPYRPNWATSTEGVELERFFSHPSHAASPSVAFLFKHLKHYEIRNFGFRRLRIIAS